MRYNDRLLLSRDILFSVQVCTFLSRLYHIYHVVLAFGNYTTSYPKIINRSSFRYFRLIQLTNPAEISLKVSKMPMNGVLDRSNFIFLIFESC